MNGNPVSVNEIIPEKTDKGNVYEVQLKVDIDQICIFQIIDLENGRIVSNRSIKLIPGMTVEFNRDFYFSNEDFDNAYVKVCDSLGLKEYDISSNDDLISYTYNGGCVEIRMDDKCLMALFMALVRGERFCDGLILTAIREGSVQRWLKRLREVVSEKN